MPHPEHLRLTTFSPNTVPTPRLVFWETTGDCNLRCVHCRREWSEAPPNELSTEEVKTRLIDAIADSGWNSILVFSGGEPLMRKDLFELLSYAQSRGVTAAVASNATLIDTACAMELAARGISRVSVSLDGSESATHDAFRGQPGSFDAAIRGIRCLRNAHIEVQVNVTFTKRNLAEASAIVDMVQRIDACALHVFVLVPVGCGVDLPEEIRLSDVEVERLLTYFDDEASRRDMEIRATCAPQAQRIRMQRARVRATQGVAAGRGLAASSKGCLAGGGILFVDAVGKVFPCGYLPTEVGSIRTSSLQEILNTSTLLASLRDVSRLEGRCAGCSFAPVCGGCRARSYGSTGDLFGEEPSCPMNKSVAPSPSRA